jgi:hypothetical protein
MSANYAYTVNITLRSTGAPGGFLIIIGPNQIVTWSEFDIDETGPVISGVVFIPAGDKLTVSGVASPDRMTANFNSLRITKL